MLSLFISAIAFGFWYLQSIPIYYQGSSYVYPEGSELERLYGKSVKLHLGDCRSRTKDNEGCLLDVSLRNNAGERIALGDWWVVRAYGKRQIQVQWLNFDNKYLGDKTLFSSDELTLGFLK